MFIIQLHSKQMISNKEKDRIRNKFGRTGLSSEENVHQPGYA